MGDINKAIAEESFMVDYEGLTKGLQKLVE
jgi:hypothetical protein